MMELAWIDGAIVPLDEARVGVEDRGYQFADGVYEVVRAYQGVTFTLAPHLERLERSAAGIRLQLPIPPAVIADEIHALVARSGLMDGMIYLQLTRGEAIRNHIFPTCARPTLLFYVRALPPVAAPGDAPGLRLVSVVDERWKRCWIKAIALLANVLAKNEAVEQGADEAVFVEDGLVSECSTSNIFAVIGGRLVTHPVGPKVLPGITRSVVLSCAAEMGLPVEERPMTESEAIAASEVFITSTTRELAWVKGWDDRTVGDGRCGPIALALHRAYQARVASELEAHLAYVGGVAVST